MPSVAVTVPLLLTFSPVKVASPVVAVTVALFVTVSVAVKATLAPLIAPLLVTVVASTEVCPVEFNLPVLVISTFRFAFPSAFLIARSFLPVTVVSTLSLPAPTFNVLSSNSIPILVGFEFVPFKATSPPSFVAFKVKLESPYFLNLIFPQFPTSAGVLIVNCELSLPLNVMVFSSEFVFSPFLSTLFVTSVSIFSVVVVSVKCPPF